MFDKNPYCRVVPSHSSFSYNYTQGRMLTHINHQTLASVSNGPIIPTWSGVHIFNANLNISWMRDTRFISFREFNEHKCIWFVQHMDLRNLIFQKHLYLLLPLRIFRRTPVFFTVDQNLRYEPYTLATQDTSCGGLLK